MRKVYLLITSALLLLGSSTLWAATVATVDGEEFDNIGTAISAWSEQGKTTLTLLSDCEYNASSYIYPWGSKILDLNGKTLTWSLATDYACYYNEDGLTVTDNDSQHKGELRFNADWGIQNYGSSSATTLNISNCKVTGRGTVKTNPSNGSKYGVGSVLYCTIGTINIENAEIVSTNSYAAIRLSRGICNITGESTIVSESSEPNVEIQVVSVYGSDSSEDENYSVLNLEQNSKLINKSNNGASYGVTVIQNSNKHAYGVVVNIDGKVYGRNAMTVLGNIKDIPGLNGVPWDANIVKVNIGSTAEMLSSIDGGESIYENGTVLYVAGYADWTIKGKLMGGSPIHAKSGTLNIDNATITATRDFYTPIEYNGSGCEPTGNAIAIESNGGYAGKVQINITNGSTIASTAGYAVEEGVVCKKTTTNNCDQVTQQIGLTVTDGAEGTNAFAGAKGTMVFSDSFAQALRDGSINVDESQTQWVQNAITSGKYSAMPEVVADGYMVAFTGDVLFPYEVVKKEDDPGITDITSITEDRVIEGDFTVEQGKALIVRTGKILEIQGKLNIGQNVNWPSQVTVEPGATLIVKDGIEIKASNVDNALLIKADSENGTGSLLYSSAAPVTLPEGTVELYMYAKDNGDGTYTWQHFGLPVMDMPVPTISKTAAAMYNDWNNGWAPSSSAAIIAKGPWFGYNTTTNAPAKGAMYKFTGAIVGNENADLYLERYGYYCFANSYTSRLSIKKLVETVNANDQTDGSVWVYDASKTPAHFDIYYQAEVDDDDFVDGGLAPMQAFFVKNDKGASTSITLNYINDVYKFIPNSGDTRASDADLNGGKITLSDGKEAATLTIREAARFSDEIEKGYDVVQMETGMIQIYALQGEYKLSAIATNNIDSKEIEILTKGETEYTLTFSNIKGNGFKLTDLASGAEIEVGEGKTYSFTAASNSTIRRFKLGEGEVSANEAEANSAVNIWAADGNVFVANNEAAADIEIYNLSGVKVAGAAANGEALQSVAINSLASGVYIVRVGEASAKVVK